MSLEADLERAGAKMGPSLGLALRCRRGNRAVRGGETRLQNSNGVYLRLKARRMVCL